MPIFLSLRTHGWEWLRARPPCPLRRSSSGVESGELGGEDPCGSGRQICSSERWRIGGAKGSEEDSVRLVKAEGQGAHWEKQDRSRVLQRAGRLKLELRCMAGKPSGTFPIPPRWTLPPLWHLLFSTVVQRREPWGRQVERLPSSSEHDRDLHWRLLGGAVDCRPSFKLRSCSKLDIVLEVGLTSQSQCEEHLCASGRTSHRLSRLVPTGLCGMAQPWLLSLHRLVSATNAVYVVTNKFTAIKQRALAHVGLLQVSSYW